MYSRNIFYALMSHEQPRTHKTHHGPNLGEAITFPLIVYYIPSHGINIQMLFCSSIPKWKSQISQNWNSHNFEGP